MSSARLRWFWRVLSLSTVACTQPHFAEIDGGSLPEADAGNALQSDLTFDAGRDDAAEAVCSGDDASTPGHDCARVITCINVGPCTLATHRCCMSLSGLDNVCTSDPICSTGARSVCDGPEDCPSGKECCVTNLASYCADDGVCPPVDVVCHSDADCSMGACVPGHGDFTFRAWGFCRG